MKTKLSKTSLALIFSFLLGIGLSLVAKEGSEGSEGSENSHPKGLRLGSTPPLADRKMTDISGKQYSLNDLKGSKGLLVIFSCNTCPYVLGWEDRYLTLADHLKDKDIGFVLVNSNEATRSDEDSLKAMKAHAKEKDYRHLKYVVDSGSALARAFSATKTPEVFLFNQDMKLVYHGAIDDNMKSAKEVKTSWLKNAVDAMVSGKEVSPQKTKSIGCSIKFSSLVSN